MCFSKRFSVGRDATCDLQLDDRKVSRTHAVVTVFSTSCAVEDRSRNGCKVAGEPVPAGGPVAWAPGASLTIHDFVLQYKVEGGHGETQPTQGVSPSEDHVHREAADRIPSELAWDGTEAKFRVASVLRETADVQTYRMMPMAPWVFGYKPGQFVGLTVEIDGKPVRRTYSISSSPSRPLALDITVKRVPGGLVSNWLADNLSKGDVVTLKKPAGKKKRMRHYTVEWRSPDGQVTLVREYERFEVAPFLIPP